MAKAHVSASLISTLPGRYYVEPEIYAAEQERIFSPLWVCTVRAAELVEPGAFQTVDIAGESLIVVRGSDGKIRAFFNVCRHRGSRICSVTAGHVKHVFSAPTTSGAMASTGRWSERRTGPPCRIWTQPIAR